MANFLTELRAIRLDAECGEYEFENKRLLNDTIAVLERAIMDMRSLMSKGEPSNEAVNAMLWDEEVEFMLFAYKTGENYADARERWRNGDTW